MDIVKKQYNAVQDATQKQDADAAKQRLAAWNLLTQKTKSSGTKSPALCQQLATGCQPCQSADALECYHLGTDQNTFASGTTQPGHAGSTACHPVFTGSSFVEECTFNAAASGNEASPSDGGSGSSAGGDAPGLPGLPGVAKKLDQAAEDDALQVAIAAGRIAADASPGLQRAAIAEELGWREAVSNGGIGIQGPGKVTTRGPDYITYDPEVDTITLWDATSGKTPKQVPVPEYWMPEARAAVRSYTGPHATEIQKALRNGQVDVAIFRYIPQGY